MSEPAAFSPRIASSSNDYTTKTTKPILPEFISEKYLGHQHNKHGEKQQTTHSFTHSTHFTNTNTKPQTTQRPLLPTNSSTSQSSKMYNSQSQQSNVSEYNQGSTQNVLLESQVEGLAIKDKQQNESDTDSLEDKHLDLGPKEESHSDPDTPKPLEDTQPLTSIDRKLMYIKSELNEVRQRIAEISSFSGCSDTSRFIKGTLFLIDIWPEQRDTLKRLSHKIKRGSMGFSPVIAQALLEKLLTYYINYSIYNTGAYISEIVKHDGTILPRWRFQQKNQRLPFEERQKICQVVRELEKARKTEKVKLIIVDRLYTVYTKIHGDEDSDEIRDQLWDIVDQAVEVSLDMWSQPMPVKSVKATEGVYTSEDYAGIPAGSEPGPNTIQLEIYPSFKTHNSLGEEYVLLRGKLLYLQ